MSRAVLSLQSEVAFLIESDFFLLIAIQLEREKKYKQAVSSAANFLFCATMAEIAEIESFSNWKFLFHFCSNSSKKARTNKRKIENCHEIIFAFHCI
jgi:hypothetical protein